jgi:hypothetical protein
MDLLMIWVSIHKNLIYGVCALGLWVFAQYWYFKYDIRNYRRLRRPHVWEVDMKTKTVVRGRSGPQ